MTDEIMHSLVEVIRQRTADSKRATDVADHFAPHLQPPATQTQVLQAEKIIGRRLPTFLSRLYLEVGNGGFGPDYGLMGVAGGARDDCGNNATAAYEENRRQEPSDPFWSWPEALLPTCHCGCGMYLCVDSSTPRGMIVWFEPNPHEDGEPWTDSFIPLNCDLQELFTAWLDGRHWTDAFLPTGDDDKEGRLL